MAVRTLEIIIKGRKLLKKVISKDFRMSGQGNSRANA